MRKDERGVVEETWSVLAREETCVEMLCFFPLSISCGPLINAWMKVWLVFASIAGEDAEKEAMIDDEIDRSIAVRRFHALFSFPLQSCLSRFPIVLSSRWII